ncbi:MULTISPECIES: hypothetical protein [unclassified Arthrobacter]|nr:MULTISPECIES: hypothetical protein [unclassified Arthrobacter]
MTKEEIQAHARAIVVEWPPLPAEVCRMVAGVLRGERANVPPQSAK